MNEILKDSRFSHIVRDPKFRKLKKKKSRVKIDERFQSMFSDEKFQIRSSIDERGRSVKLKRSKDLKRYYDLSESSSEEEISENEQKSENEEEVDEDKEKSESEEEVDDEENENDSEEEEDGDDNESESEEEIDKGDNESSEEEIDKDDNESSEEEIESDEKTKVKEKKKKSLTNKSNNKNKPSRDGNKVSKVSKKNKNGLPASVKKKLKDLSVDYARGEGAIFSESSSEEESSDDSEALEFDHMWGELDKDVETTEESTNRLAVCNMNWDRIKAVDLMILFNSFLPPDGLIHSVTIYPSEFGLERMKEEDKKGPQELINVQKEEENEQEEVLMEKLRKYQLNRLKYYYAVVVCDSAETANVLYKEADGLEYERSCNKIDLRFIPDDVTFDQEPRETCTQMPDSNEYVPKGFQTSALTKAKVNLTWDETDKSRMDIVKSACEGNIDENGLKQLLASSSSEESEEENINENNDSDARSDTNSKMGYIDKYKALLADIENKEKIRKNNEVNLEVKWNLNLENKANEFVKEAVKGKDEKTPFQQYLEKRKEKKKKKREERKAQFNEEKNGSGESVFSDDDIPSDIDLNDPYFREEFESSKKKKEKKKKPKEEEVEDEETKQKKAELELLMLDDEDESRHFSLKKIQENEKASKKSKKSKNDKKFIDDFKMDLNDERFSAVYTSHHFNIDPTDPQFKPTKATKALIEEKLRRREKEDPIFSHRRISEEEPSSKKFKSAEPSVLIKNDKEPNNKKSKSAELSALVKNIKKNISEVKKNEMIE